MRRFSLGGGGGLGWRLPAKSVRFLLAFLLAAAVLVWWQAWRSLRPGLEVVFLDVGQGDSIIIRSPLGRSLLIDAGGREGHSADRGEIGRWVVIPALYREGIGRVDGVIATHPHDDHIGGLDEVIEEVPIGMLLDSGEAHPTPAYERFLAAAKKRRLQIIPAKAGQIFNLGAGIRAEVLHPDLPFLQGTEDDLNNNSVVVRLTYGEVSFLFAGDIQQEGEGALLSDYPNISATVLKVAHHGSMDSTSEEFLAKVRPKWAVILAGRQNPFGHPHGETLEHLKKLGVRVFRTDEMGTIVMRTDGRSLRAEWGRGNRRSQAEMSLVNQPIQ